MSTLIEEEQTVFKYTELSDEARERAREQWAENYGYDHAEEAFRSLKALAQHFGGNMTDWDIDYFGGYSWCNFDMPDAYEDEEDELVAEALFTEVVENLGFYNPETIRGIGDCVLTGYCHDESAIDGFRREFIVGGERDLNKLMEAAFQSWLTAVQEDCEYQYSEEAFAEHCEANEYEFDEDGNLV